MHSVSPGVYHCSGPQTIGRFGANTSGDDCTPHRAGKDSKSSGSPGLSTANTFIPCGLAISSCGLTSISTIAATAFGKSCKEPKERYFIEADIQPHFCNRKYFGVQTAKNGDRGTIVYSAALRCTTVPQETNTKFTEPEGAPRSLWSVMSQPTCRLPLQLSATCGTAYDTLMSPSFSGATQILKSSKNFENNGSKSQGPQ